MGEGCRRGQALIALVLGVAVSPFTVYPLPVAAAEETIAYVNVDRAFDGYQKTKVLDQQLEQRSTAKQQERERMVAEIRKQKDELELMSEKGRADHQAAITQKIQALQEFDRQSREELRQEREQMLKAVLKDIEGAVMAYAKGRYTLVLSDRAILYAEKPADITDDVVKALNGAEKGR